MPVATQVAWQWNDPSTWFQGPPPPTPAPTGTTPDPNQTPETEAQGVIARYWQWQAAGAKTVQGASDGKGGFYQDPVDPATGQGDPNFPSVADITAAESLLTRKQADDPDAVAAAKAQAAATLNDTLARTAQTQAQTQKDSQTAHPNVSPGQGVWDPTANGGTGGYVVPIAAKPDAPAAPHQTQDQINTASTDAHNTSVQDQANKQTPDQIQAAALARITAQGHQDVQDAIDIANSKLASGEVMPEADRIALQSKLDGINDGVRANYTQQQTLYAHNLDQPNVDRTAAIAQENADTSEKSRADAANQADINQKSDVLRAQATQGSGLLDTLVKAGVAPSMGSVSAAYDPLQAALQLSRQAVASGQVPPSAMPTPSAPQPAASVAGPPSAPLPAPGVQPATDTPPAAPPPDPGAPGEDQSDVQPPPYGGP